MAAAVAAAGGVAIGGAAVFKAGQEVKAAFKVAVADEAAAFQVGREVAVGVFRVDGEAAAVAFRVDGEAAAVAFKVDGEAAAVAFKVGGEVAAAVFKVAREAGGFAGGPGGGDPAARLQRMDGFLKQFDTRGDGVIRPNEIPADRKAMFDRMASLPLAWTRTVLLPSPRFAKVC